MSPILQIEDLAIETEDPRPGSAPIVTGIDLSVHPGEVVALIGESGSGKTTIALSALGYLRPGLVRTRGRVLMNGADVLEFDGPALRALRGHKVAYVSQSAAAGFNPGLTIDEQVIEPVLEHRIAKRSVAKQHALELYAELGLPDPQRIGTCFPHEVSGGQLQRLMAAMAMGSGPDLIVFDEPTTALDVTTQISVLMSFKKLIRERRAAAIYVSHDLAVVAQIADRIIVLLNGEIQESGATDELIARPKSEYTRILMLASDPGRASPASGAVAPASAGVASVAHDRRRNVTSEPVLTARSLIAGYGTIDATGMPANKALSDVSLTLQRGRFLGVIGESGSGKSTLARVIAGLVPRTGGEVLLGRQPLAPGIDRRTRDQLRRLQIVFQAADTALNPKHTIGKVLGRVVEHLLGLSGHACKQKVASVLDMVQLSASFVNRFPQQLSGGQKQRVNLARALVADPDVIICDEVTSALDSVVREQIIKLLQDLKERLGLSVILISHDISTIAALAEDTIVMLRGAVVEAGLTIDVLNRPQHAYSKVLIGSVPQLRTGWLEEAVAKRAKINLPPDALLAIES
ncbi:MAG: ABC transporter ATP-binding protein [Casimicrobiaceae bacterium]